MKRVSSKQLDAVQEAPAMTEDMLLEQQAALAALGKPSPPGPPTNIGCPHCRPLWSLVCLSDMIRSHDVLPAQALHSWRVS